MVEKMPSSAVLSVRVSPDEKAMLQLAADQTHSTVSEFMRRKALEEAEDAMMQRTVVMIPADQWDAFEALLKAPAQEIPALKELAHRTPVWER